MRKFAVFSGFLGSGKTTTMIALTRYHTAHHGKAAMISNDLGEGVTLADDRLARLSGVNASQITDECICFCHDVLTARLNECYGDGCELVVSDIPGFGVGALEHVYHGLSAEYPGQFELAPFTVLIEPRNAALLRENRGGDMAHILRAQLKEADLIVLNKCDLLNAAELEADRVWLAGHYPQANVIAISAATGEGLEDPSRALMQGSASMRHPDIDYDDDDLQNALDQLTEYYLEYVAQVCCNDFDGTEYLLDIAGAVQAELRIRNCEIPHMKLLAWEPEGDFGKVDLLGADRPLEVTRRFARPCTDVAVILNANAACPAAVLDGVIRSAVEETSDRYQLELRYFKKECFNLGE
jgi:Ni2+-binding GTPase involved in maturation of urease and hydrogenase